MRPAAPPPDASVSGSPCMTSGSGSLPLEEERSTSQQSEKKIEEYKQMVKNTENAKQNTFKFT